MSRLLKSTLVGLFLTAAVTVGPGLHPARASGTAQGPDGALRTAYTHVRVTVEGHVARTEVDQVFVNDLPSPVEATFGFPLPADATVTGFADWRDGKKVDAQVAGHDQAAAQYEAAAAAGRRAALAETEGDRFHVRLFAIPGRGSRRISLTYVQTVDALGSTRTLVFPAEHVAKPSVLDLDVDVSGAGSVEALTAPNHADTQLSAGRAILSRAGRGLDHDFVLRWREKAASLDLAGRAARSVKFGADEPGYLPLSHPDHPKQAA